MPNLDVNNIDMFLKVRTSAELLVAMWAFKLFDLFVNCVDMSLLKIKCSIGIAIYPEHGKDEKLLVINADMAMYQAKKSGKNQAKLYEETMLH